MSVLTISVGLIFSFFMVLAYFYLYKGAEIQRFDNNVEIKTYKNLFRGDITVVDAKSGKVLFWYHDDAEIKATKVEKLDDGKWIITIEDIDKK